LTRTQEALVAEAIQTGIRIYLDLAALERLIGGSSEAEVEIREGIVRTFAKKHLKELANLEAFQPYLKKIAGAVEEELKAQIPLVTIRAPRWKGDPEERYKLDDSNLTVAKFKSQLAAEAVQQIQPLCNRAVQQAREDVAAQFTKAITALKAEVDKTVEKQLSRNVEQIVKNEVERRLKEIAKNLAKAS
jgi:hypothetical protein